jgi:pimeloyl-ACP methyl ester carboxylesterase
MRRLCLLVLTLIITIPSAYAKQILIFIHGYGGNSNSWIRHGVVEALMPDGWQWVPSFSQHLEYVPALEGKAYSMRAGNKHGLRFEDGLIIRNVVHTLLK